MELRDLGQSPSSFLSSGRCSCLPEVPGVRPEGRPPLGGGGGVGPGSAPSVFSSKMLVGRTLSVSFPEDPRAWYTVGAQKLLATWLAHWLNQGRAGQRLLLGLPVLTPPAPPHLQFLCPIGRVPWFGPALVALGPHTPLWPPAAPPWPSQYLPAAHLAALLPGSLKAAGSAPAPRSHPVPAHLQLLSCIFLSSPLAH